MTTWRDRHLSRRKLIDGFMVAVEVAPEMHGTHTAYANYGCRCGPCRKANTRHSALMRHNRLLRRVFRDGYWYAVEAERHGRYGTYVNWGCRCAPCTQANTNRASVYRGKQ